MLHTAGCASKSYVVVKVDSGSMYLCMSLSITVCGCKSLCVCVCVIMSVWNSVIILQGEYVIDVNVYSCCFIIFIIF